MPANEQPTSAKSLPTDNWPTSTTRLQHETESLCTSFFVRLETLPQHELEQLQAAGFLNDRFEVRLLREKHVPYLVRGLEYLPPGFASMDASRPWFMYWILHSLELLDDEADVAAFASRCINTIQRCWCSQLENKGGFGGGILQLGHLATTYASCLALAIIGTAEAYAIVDRPALLAFFLSLKDPETGAFRAHDHGELDVRTTYCAISIAALYGILTPELTFGVVDFVKACQTYEGGFGPFPFQEAHGGYNFCAAAILSILDGWDAIDEDALVHYIAHRQMAVEGGYQGRTNKLVDGCYSFWQGSVPALLSLKRGHYVSNTEAHQKYILLCGQQIEGTST
ncbi:hypothetical protein, variant 1 [Aphanomyces invadans]|uniref:Protein farnesyltransferase subunit beta n=1 Tax=Aphanomyces invadans TaxID=157072 RepID=A0A024TPA8_9STRA|nr:hypothetical protein, variant 1 [Aphanomyces invadans]ETV95202.1 hypothetical protein, variant 1 [Aphanomyces invadans]|eukprot:XP_008876375.1 hypothetical protein, variant 1 [Aphanomyces invadans]